MTPSNKGLTNRLLGYPADARLLIVNADDFGMCQAVNEAVFRVFQNGVLRSTTLMVPWALHAMHFLFLMSQQVGEIVQEEGIILLDYRALQEAWKGSL
jgi:hypothetical protein